MQVVRGWNYSDHVVATVSAQLLWHENRDKEQEEVDANAHLIAAAPELAEACKAAWNCISELPASQARVEAVLMLRAALAKAKGEEA
jgi:hypothetical protein